MLVLNANQEQKQVFNRLIQEMDAQVVWNGRFVLMGDRLILEGFVRSLFFHFDIQQIEVKLTELVDDEEEELEITDYRGLEDVIAMAVYAFEKWGILKGVRTEQDVPQLNQMFKDVLRVYQIDVEFSGDAIQFSKAGMRITYEDVAETVLAYEKEAKENLNIEVQEPVLRLPAAGWQKDTSSDSDTRDSQAAAERIEKYHARIGVLDRLSDLQRKTLLRDIRNDKLLNDQEKEELYYPVEDYEKQLTKTTSAQEDQNGDSQAAAERIEKYHARISVLDRLSQLQRRDLLRDIRNDKLLNEKEKEELYYPIEDYEKQLQLAANQELAGNPSVSGYAEADRQTGRSSQNEESAAAPARDTKAVQERIEKYHARLSVLDRLSDLQKKTLLRDIRNDRLLNEKEKEALFFPIQDLEYQERMYALDVTLGEDENRTYAYIRREISKVEKEELFEKTKRKLLDRLNDLLTQYGIQEVRQIMEAAPQHVERAEYQELVEKLAPYEGIDLGPYKEPLRKMRETLEIKEISNMLMQSRKRDRRDYMLLLRQIEERGFAQENAAPYIERILEWVAELDAARLKSLLTNVSSMDVETAASLYEMITEESFLPKFRKEALAVISRRLEQLCLAECAMLVRVFEKTMASVIHNNPGHHFYPAEKILQKTVRPEEVRLIDNAVSAYVEKRGRFEYPIFMVDVSKEGNGRDGMLLTPEHLFYSTRLNGYRIPVASIQSVRASSGLLNHRTLVAEERNGVKHKLPYAVEEDELQAWADLLWKFIRYLKKRKGSETMTQLLQQEETETVICSRCGCVCQEQVRCPECGKVLERA